MSAERKRMPMVAAMMMGMVLSDPEALLFGYALAMSKAKSDEDYLEIAKFYKENAEALGVTDEQFQNAVDVMKNTDEYLNNLDKTS
jgi:hypothetical protein